MARHSARPASRGADGLLERLRVLAPVLGLVACGPTMPVQTIAPAPGEAAAAQGAGQAAAPVAVDSSSMTARVRPSGGARCAGETFPIDGRAAFDAAVRAATSGPTAAGIRRVTVVGERLSFSQGAGAVMLGQVMLAPTATIVTRVRLDTDAGRSVTRISANGMGRRSYNDFVGCAALAEALADAYRESLRDLSSQVSEHLMLVGWTVAGVPPFR